MLSWASKLPNATSRAVFWIWPARTYEISGSASQSSHIWALFAFFRFWSGEEGSAAKNWATCYWSCCLNSGWSTWSDSRRWSSNPVSGHFWAQAIHTSMGARYLHAAAPWAWGTAHRLGSTFIAATTCDGGVSVYVSWSFRLFHRRSGLGTCSTVWL